MFRDGVEMSDDDFFPGSWDSITQRNLSVLLQYFLEDLNTFQVAHLFKTLYAVMVTKISCASLMNTLLVFLN